MFLQRVQQKDSIEIRLTGIYVYVGAIVAVERGGAIFSPAIAQRMIQYFSSSSAASSKKNQPDEFAKLTEREFEILDLIAQGYKKLAISNRLSLSIKTVQNYVSSILTKLEVANRSHAIVRAREAGLEKGKQILVPEITQLREPEFVCWMGNCKVLRRFILRHTRQVQVYGSQFLIIHAPNGFPWHSCRVKRIFHWIDTRAECVDELFLRPGLHHFQVRANRG